MDAARESITIPVSTGFAKAILYNPVERGVFMIVDVTGVVLTPGNWGNDCLGNGEHPGIECCCDECDYMICCLTERMINACASCDDPDCPRKDNSGIFMKRT